MQHCCAPLLVQGSEKYERTNQLSQKVAAWQERLAPLLEAEERHLPFDIHRYSQRILTSLASHQPVALTPIGPKKAAVAPPPIVGGKSTNAAAAGGDAVQPFGQLVRGVERYEVCRLFLASLQLANSGNVELEHQTVANGSFGVDATQQLRLRLLKASPCYDMANYRGGSPVVLHPCPVHTF